MNNLILLHYLCGAAHLSENSESDCGQNLTFFGAGDIVWRKWRGLGGGNTKQKKTLKGRFSTLTWSIALILSLIELESYSVSSMYLQIEILGTNMPLFGKLVN